MVDDADFIESLKRHYLEHHHAMLKARQARTSEKLTFPGRKIFSGYSSEEVDWIRAYQNVDRLPTLYVAYMRQMGNSPIYIGHEAFQSYSMKIGKLKFIYNRIQEKLLYRKGENYRVSIPVNAFIFATKDWFWFFRCDGNDDPPVYFYDGYFFNDPIGDFSYRVADHLSEWLMQQALNPMPFVEEAKAQKQILHLAPEEAMPIPTEKRRHKRFKIKSIEIDTSQVPPVDDQFAEKLVSHYSEFRLTQPRVMQMDFIGLSEQEIQQVAEAQGVTHLPLVFREFLRVMGKQMGGMFIGADVGLRLLLKLKSALIAEMQSEREFHVIPTLPENAIVFLVYQGVEFFWFEALPDVDDPPVMLYIQQESEFLKVADRLSEWLWTQASDPLAIVESSPNEDPF